LVIRVLVGTGTPVLQAEQGETGGMQAGSEIEGDRYIPAHRYGVHMVHCCLRWIYIRIYSLSCLKQPFFKLGIASPSVYSGTAACLAALGSESSERATV
jgi:hypothetical protein